MPEADEGCDMKADSSSPVMCGTVLSRSRRHSDASSSTKLDGGWSWPPLHRTRTAGVEQPDKVLRPSAEAPSSTHRCSPLYAVAWVLRTLQRLCNACEPEVLQKEARVVLERC